MDIGEDQTLTKKVGRSLTLVNELAMDLATTTKDFFDRNKTRDDFAVEYDDILVVSMRAAIKLVAFRAAAFAHHNGGQDFKSIEQLTIDEFRREMKQFFDSLNII